MTGSEQHNDDSPPSRGSPPSAALPGPLFSLLMASPGPAAGPSESDGHTAEPAAYEGAPDLDSGIDPTHIHTISAVGYAHDTTHTSLAPPKKRTRLLHIPPRSEAKRHTFGHGPCRLPDSDTYKAHLHPLLECKPMNPPRDRAHCDQPLCICCASRPWIRAHLTTPRARFRSLMAPAVVASGQTMAWHGRFHPRRVRGRRLLRTPACLPMSLSRRQSSASAGLLATSVRWSTRHSPCSAAACIYDPRVTLFCRRWSASSICIGLAGRRTSASICSASCRHPRACATPVPPCSPSAWAGVPIRGAFKEPALRCARCAIVSS